MKLSELIKATVVCGSMAYLVFSYPVIGQVVIIGLLALAWFACAHQTLKSLGRK